MSYIKFRHQLVYKRGSFEFPEVGARWSILEWCLSTDQCSNIRTVVLVRKLSTGRWLARDTESGESGIVEWDMICIAHMMKDYERRQARGLSNVS